MKRVTYAGTSFVTGTLLADSLLDLVAALGSHGATASVTLPSVDEDGRVASVDLVIGPSSEVIAVDSPERDPELVDDAALTSLEDHRAALSPPRAEVSGADIEPGWNLPDVE
jgi:hypothetical protein